MQKDQSLANSLEDFFSFDEPHLPSGVVLKLQEIHPQVISFMENFNKLLPNSRKIFSGDEFDLRKDLGKNVDIFFSKSLGIDYKIFWCFLLNSKISIDRDKIFKREQEQCIVFSFDFRAPFPFSLDFYGIKKRKGTTLKFEERILHATEITPEFFSKDVFVSLVSLYRERLLRRYQIEGEMESNGIRFS